MSLEISPSSLVSPQQFIDRFVYVQSTSASLDEFEVITQDDGLSPKVVWDDF
jgi:hypothetical protein